jgi:Leucine-rich repeat (LRR) protein
VNLEFLVLSGNNFNTTVPLVFATLPRLEFLYISDSFMQGNLNYMLGMQAISEHWIDLNQNIGGTIPAFIGSISSLGSFSVSQSALTGTLPSELGDLFRMQSMWFYGNQLTGTIPLEYGDLSRMKVLRVEENPLTGSMPDSICQLRNIGAFGGILRVLGAPYSLVVSH